jgi:hypothetical protein
VLVPGLLGYFCEAVLAVLKQHCEQLGRDYESIKRTTLIDDCIIAETEADVLARLTTELEPLRLFARECIQGKDATKLILPPH